MVFGGCLRGLVFRRRAPQLTTPAQSTQPTQPSDPGPLAPVRERSWSWHANPVIVVDQDAWDEPICEWVYWCTKCQCEVPYSHSEDMFVQGNGHHSIAEKQIQTGAVHHDAVTHEEDRGWYECSCGDTR